MGHPPHHPINFKHEGSRSKKVSEWFPLHVQQKISGGHQEEGHRVVHHVQGEHHQTYLLHHYQNASIQGRQIQCRMDQLKVSHVDKEMMEQSHTNP